MNDFYNAYLLRLQRTDATSRWRAVLEDAHTGEILRFASETELLLYLLQKLDTQQKHEKAQSSS
jgi:hypothetical protein